MELSEVGKYRVIAQLGKGGMAEVYLGVLDGPAGFNKLVVLKILQDHLAQEGEDFVRMFLDEARLAAGLNHPNIVQTNEVGRDGDVHFIAMEYLEGQPLHSVLKRAKGKMPAALFLRIVSQVLEGLGAAHSAKGYEGAPLQIVHRDVSPHNIIVTYSGQAKVVDFGIAKANGRLAEATALGVVKGKVSFMAPEQVTGGRVDARADLFAVGLMLFDFFSPQRIWHAKGDVEIVGCLLAGTYPRSPRELGAEIPDAIHAIIERALAPDAEDRFASAEEMQTALEAYLSDVSRGGSPRAIGEFVGQLFATERSAIASVIERQLKAIRDTEGAPSLPTAMADLRDDWERGRTPSVSRARNEAEDDADHIATTTGAPPGARRSGPLTTADIGVVARELGHRPKATPQRWLRGVGLVAIAAAAVVSIVMAIRTAPRERPTVTRAAESALPAVAASPAPTVVPHAGLATSVATASASAAPSASPPPPSAHVAPPSVRVEAPPSRIVPGPAHTSTTRPASAPTTTATITPTVASASAKAETEPSPPALPVPPRPARPDVGY